MLRQVKYIVLLIFLRSLDGFVSEKAILEGKKEHVDTSAAFYIC